MKGLLIKFEPLATVNQTWNMAGFSMTRSGILSILGSKRETTRRKKTGWQKFMFQFWIGSQNKLGPLILNSPNAETNQLKLNQKTKRGPLLTLKSVCVTNTKVLSPSFSPFSSVEFFFSTFSQPFQRL